MNREEFQETLMDVLRDKLPEDCKIDIVATTKTNDVAKSGIVVKSDRSNLSPTVYLDDLYDDYCNGRSIDDISNFILDVSTNNLPTLNADELLSKDNILDKVIFKMRNIEINKNYLENVPVQTIEGMDDIVLVPYMPVELGGIGNKGAIVVQNQIIEMAGIDKDELFNAATHNSEKAPVHVRKMSELLGGMFMDEIGEANEVMYVAMDETFSGVSPLASRDFYEKVEEKMGTDRFVILPSSVNELVIIRKDMMPDREMLFQMVKEVNSTVRSEEILGYNIYEYDQGRMQTCVAESGLERYAEME
jgi:hypothetical protein